MPRMPSEKGGPQEAETERADRARTSLIMTTEQHGNLRIAERICVVSAQCAFGADVCRNIVASVQETVDGRVKAVEQKMQDGVDVVLSELEKQALQLHADAALDITLHYTLIGYGLSNMTLISGIGTAVTFEA